MKDHYSAAMELCRNKKGFTRELEEFHKDELLRFKEAGIKEVKILSAGAGNSCGECLKLSGKVFTIEEALKTMPLPVKCCSTDVFDVEKGFCRCIYIVC